MIRFPQLDCGGMSDPVGPVQPIQLSCAARGYMFQGAMGGSGDLPFYTVTEDWPWTTEQFWVNYHCWGAEDASTDPICSFKRYVAGNFTQISHSEMGDLMRDNDTLLGFQLNYQGEMSNSNWVKNMFLGNVLQMKRPTGKCLEYLYISMSILNVSGFKMYSYFLNHSVFQSVLSTLQQ